MMRLHNNRNNGVSVTRRLGTPSAKTVAAIALMTVMCLLWVRVLLRNTSSQAHAAEIAEETVSVSASSSSVTVVPQSLPAVSGRHDVLRHDFFSPDNWPSLGGAETRRTAEGGDDARQRQLTTFFKSLEKTLTLDAILHTGGGLPMRVSIDGNVLSQGQTLPVHYGTETYELIVFKIGRQQVVLTWDQWNVVLSMAQPEHGD